ncbi:MAG: hypothetical protein NT007_18800 [Candidatus Kapabacteria bacterium]|nr:hypothetical protein [Candidatus Kapabacteria bacterium]
MYSNLLVNTGNTYFKYAVNKDYKLKRNVSITNKDISDEVLVKTVILDKYDSEGKPIEKTISTNLRRECWLPLAIIISLMLSSPFFTRKSFLMNLTKAILLIQLFIGFKLYVFAYDNYNYPEFAIKKLPFLIDGIVYYGNAFLNITGSSTTVIIPFFIWLIIIGVQLIGKVKFSD